MSVTIEVATTASDGLLEGLNHLLPQLSSTAPPLTMNDVEALVSSPALTFFVAMQEGIMVGTLTLVIFPIPTGLRAWIEDVVVDESARGLGVGAALTNAATDEAQRRGVRSVDLTSRPSREAANALYQKLGFVVRDTNVYRCSLES
ncbi:MAG: GNAT family N-acetyltransferase [Acidimicrobiales bacterium]|jgi:ribosomal protein S18 acetylase RimI-like enzyme